MGVLGGGGKRKVKLKKRLFSDTPMATRPYSRLVSCYDVIIYYSPLPTMYLDARISDTFAIL